MTPPWPKRIIVEFEDGVRSEVSYGDLPSLLWAEILRQPFASRQSPGDESGTFVLVEWTDGWREVSSVDRTVMSVVLRRPNGWKQRIHGASREGTSFGCDVEGDWP